MTVDQLKAVLGSHKWSLIMAFVMILMIGFGYQTARYLDEDRAQALDFAK